LTEQKHADLVKDIQARHTEQLKELSDALLKRDQLYQADLQDLQQKQAKTVKDLEDK